MISSIEKTIYPRFRLVKDNLEKFMTLVREFPARPTRPRASEPPESIPMSRITKHPRQPTTTRAASTAACLRPWPGGWCVLKVIRPELGVEADFPAGRTTVRLDVADFAEEETRRGGGGHVRSFDG